MIHAMLFLMATAGRAEVTAPNQDPLVVAVPRFPESARLNVTGLTAFETPSSVSVLSRAQMDDRGATAITDLIGDDAAVGENYAPLGYYESLSIRGFTLDNASGYRRNGLTIANESSMPLENKERVEIMKGVAGFDSGQAAPGGIVDYVTKRPTEVPTRSLTLQTGGRGTTYAAVDLGGRFDDSRVGYRLNAAAEKDRPYVPAAVGRREFLSADLDWRVAEGAVLAFDADWQKKSQLSVPGYMALGGSALPNDVRPETMLNNQSWSRPVAIESSNLGGRFDYESPSDWRLAASYNRNRLMSEDNAAFPYGCSSGPTYLTTFCANGDYDLYDYRSSGERRVAGEGRIEWSATRTWRGVSHEAAIGASRFDRRVSLGTEVYDYVGTDNIYDPNPMSFAPSPNSPGAVHRNQSYVEQALFLRDAITLTPRWRLDAALRIGDVSDDHFSKVDGSAVSHFRRAFLSPQAALSFAPSPSLRAYTAYSEGLELGGAAPVTAVNAGEIMNPLIARQVEAGVKSENPNGPQWTAAVFHIWKRLEFLDPDNVYVQHGVVAHDGAELEASGRLTDRLRTTTSIVLLHARQSGTGVDAFDGKAPVNVPWLRGQENLEWDLPGIPGARLDGTWAHVSSKFARRDNTLAVPGYDRFDAGVRYAFGRGWARIVWRLRVENLLDTVYWKDSGEYFGDGYLHLGAPRTFATSVQVAL